MKVLFIMLVVVLLVALAVPAFADPGGVPNEGGDPNENANWGQAHKDSEDVSGDVKFWKGEAEADDSNWGQFIKNTLKPMVE